MTTALDADWMERAALGDREAIAVLYDRYAAALLGVAIRIVGAREEAEDVIHDLFVSLPVRARHYTIERGSVAAWLTILARNASLDWLRRRQRQARVVRDAAAAPPAEGGARDPESGTLAASARESVRAALAALPPAQRLALEAAFFEGLTYAQIAEREGVPLSTIKSRCARGLFALRECLAKSASGPAT